MKKLKKEMFIFLSVYLKILNWNQFDYSSWIIDQKQRQSTRSKLSRQINGGSDMKKVHNSKWF